MNNFKVLLLICAMLIAAPSAVAQSYYQLWYDGAPVSGSNQLPVDATVSVTVSGITTLDSITDPVGIKGADGAAITSATNSFPIRVSADGTNYVSATHGLYFNILQGNAVVSASNTLPVRPSADGTNPVDATHGLYFNTLQGNAVISATNGTFANILQGNAVISATHGLFTNILQGDAVVSASNPLPAQLSLAGVAVSAGVPLPVTVISGGGVSLVGVKGEDVTTIATTVNPVPVALYSTGSVPDVNIAGFNTPVGVCGTDGANIASPTNPIDVNCISGGVNGAVALMGTNPAAAADLTNPVSAQIAVSGSVASAGNPLSVRLSTDTAGVDYVSATNPLPTSPDGSTVTNAHGAITADASVQTVTLTSPCRHISMWTSSGSPSLVISFTGTDPDTSVGVVLYGGAGLKQDFGTPISSFKYVGASGSGEINYVAQ